MFRITFQNYNRCFSLSFSLNILDPGADFKYTWHIHAWVIVLIVILMLVVFSAVFGCWRNMKQAAQNMRGVEIRPPVVR